MQVQSKTAAMAYPPTPSCCTIFGMPSVRPFAKPGTVCTLTFVASNAHSLQHQDMLYALSAATRERLLDCVYS